MMAKALQISRKCTRPKKQGFPFFFSSCKNARRGEGRRETSIVGGRAISHTFPIPTAPHPGSDEGRRIGNFRQRFSKAEMLICPIISISPVF